MQKDLSIFTFYNDIFSTCWGHFSYFFRTCLLENLVPIFRLKTELFVQVSQTKEQKCGIINSTCVGFVGLVFILFTTDQPSWVNQFFLCFKSDVVSPIPFGFLFSKKNLLSLFPLYANRLPSLLVAIDYIFLMSCFTFLITRILENLY